MTDQNNNALVLYEPKAIQRKVDREKDHMEATAEIGKAVIENGAEIHAYATAKMVESAQFAHLLLQGAKQNLNGTYDGVEETTRRLIAIYQDFVFRTTGQAMASFLRQAESMPINPEVGFVARLGDGIAEVQDEWKRLQRGG